MAEYSSPLSLPYPKLHKASKQAYLRWDGEYVYFGKYGTAAADNKYQEWKNRILHGATAASSTYMLIDLINEYATTHAAKVHHEKIKALKELGPLIALRCGEYSPIAYRSHREIIASSGTRCGTYINSIMQLMQRIVRYGVSIGKVDIKLYNTLKTVDPLKSFEVERQGRKRKAADRKDVERTLESMNDMAADITRLLLFTGARPGEICSMKASEIDKNGPRGTWVYRPQLHKTAHRGKSKYIVFGEKGREIVQRWWPAKGDLFFPSQVVVGHYKTKSLLQAVHHACHRVGVPIWTPYQLRHLKLTELSVNEGLQIAAQVAGHGETGTTKGYSHQPDKRAIDDAA